MAAAEDEDHGFDADAFVRIQQRMEQREQIRKPPRQTEFEKKKKLKDVENPKWKEQYDKHAKKQEEEIAKKYEEKRKQEMAERQIEDARIAKDLEERIKETEEKRKENAVLKDVPQTSDFAKNYNKHLRKQQKAIDRKYKEKVAKEGGISTRVPKNKEDMKDEKEDDDIDDTPQSTNSEVVEEKSLKPSTAAEIKQEKKQKDKSPKGKKDKKGKKGKKGKKKKVALQKDDTILKVIETKETLKVERFLELFPSNIKIKDKLKNNLLHLAIKHEHIAALKILLPKCQKSQIDGQNFHGNTPLLEAVIREDIESIKVLLKNKKKPDLNIININGRTALIHAAFHNYSAIVELLLNHKPTPNIEVSDKADKTALWWAVNRGQLDIVTMLLKAGASFEKKDKRGKTIEEHATGVVKKLLDNQHYKNAVIGLSQCQYTQRMNLMHYLITIIAEYAYGPLIEPKIKKDKKGKGKGKKRRRNRTNRT